MPRFVCVLRNCGGLCMSKPHISVMFFYPVLHCSPCFAYIYFAAFTWNSVYKKANKKVLLLHVIAKSGNASQEIAGRWQNNSLCPTNMSLGSNRKTLSDETFCFLENCLLSIFKFCSSSNVLFSYQLLIAHHQLSWNVFNFL